MKLYKLQLIKRYLDYITVEESLLDMYRQSTNPFMQDQARQRIRARETEIREQGIRAWTESKENEWYNLTKQDIVTHRRKFSNLPDEYTWKAIDQEPLKLLPQNYTIIRHYVRFYRDDFYGYKGSFRCKPCDEKVQGYVITKGANEETGKGGQIIVSFCAVCETKFFLQGKMDKETKSMIAFAYRALEKEQVRVRQRGGSRVTMDEMNGTDTEAPQQQTYHMRYDYDEIARTAERIRQIRPQRIPMPSTDTWYGGLETLDDSNES